MKIPITRNYDNTEIIGYIYSKDEGMFFKFNEEERITKNSLFEILGSIGFTSTEVEYDIDLNDFYFVEGQIWCFTALTTGLNYKSPASSDHEENQ